MTQTSDPSAFLLAEYKELRGEILKRSEIQHQLISITLVAFGALATAGLKDSPDALLAYPMLALFLAAAWSYNDIQIAQLGIYIRYRVEDKLIGGHLGWEHALLSTHTSKQIGALIKLATRGIFWGSEFLALGLFLLKRMSTGFPAGRRELMGEIALMILAGIAVVLTLVVMRNRDSLVNEIVTDMKASVAPAPGDEPAI